MNFFDDFETNDLTDYWEVVDDDWSSQASIVKYGSYAAYGDGGTGGAGRSLQQISLIEGAAWADGTFPLMLHCWVRFSNLVGDEYQSYTLDSDAWVYWSVKHEDDWSTYNTVDGWKNYATACFSTVTWYRLEVGMLFSGSQFVPYLNRALQSIQALEDRNNAAVDKIRRTVLYADPNVGRDMWVDDYYIRVWAGAAEPDLYNWGEEEGEGAGTTTTIDPEVQWGITSLTVLLGLCMVPASGLYLVKGGKEEISGDKVFYFLIAFMIGWALVIGGIMP